MRSHPSSSRPARQPEITCVIDNKLFTPHHRGQVTCSKKCSRELDRRRRAKWYAIKKKQRPPRAQKRCVIDNKLFTPFSNRQTVCSEECKLKRDALVAKARRDRDPEKFRAYGRARYAANPEKAKANSRRWVSEHKEQFLTTQRGYRERNRETIRAKQRARRKANPERERAQSRASYRRNKLKRNAESRANYRRLKTLAAHGLALIQGGKAASRKRGRGGEISDTTRARITLAACLRLLRWKDFEIAAELYPVHSAKTDAWNAAKNSIFKAHAAKLLAEQEKLSKLTASELHAKIEQAKTEIRSSQKAG